MYEEFEKSITFIMVKLKSTLGSQDGLHRDKSKRMSSAMQGYSVLFMGVYKFKVTASGIPIRLEMVQMTAMTTAALVFLALNLRGRQIAL